MFKINNIIVRTTSALNRLIDYSLYLFRTINEKGILTAKPVAKTKVFLRPTDFE